MADYMVTHINSELIKDKIHRFFNNYSRQYLLVRTGKVRREEEIGFSIWLTDKRSLQVLKTFFKSAIKQETAKPASEKVRPPTVYGFPKCILRTRVT